MIILTKGPNGAACFTSDQYYHHPGYRVQVVDTVGSGDAFLAAFLSGHLNGEDIPTSLMKGCRYGAYVASKKGGTPVLNVEELNTIAV